MMDSQILLSIQNLTKSFSNQVVLSHVQLTCARGQLSGLLGQNGAGKTTLLKSILSLNYLDQGQIMFDGVDIANGQHEFKRSQIGSLIEYPHFPSHYTVQQVLQEQITMMGQKTTPEYITTIGDLLDLNPIWNTSVKKLSLGAKQRVGLARAVCTCPQLLLLDEPLNGLDPLAVQRVITLLKFLLAHNTCILVATHLFADLQKLTNHWYLVKNQQVQPITAATMTTANLQKTFGNQYED